jgi:hypothetical protein
MLPLSLSPLGTDPGQHSARSVAFGASDVQVYEGRDSLQSEDSHVLLQRSLPQTGQANVELTVEVRSHSS